MRPRSISGAQFENFLGHLSPNREQAGVRYEQLRRRLTSLFVYRRCASPEELADETLDRVAQKLDKTPPATGQPDPAGLVFGIAWNVARESFHVRQPVPLPDGCDPLDPSPPVDEPHARDRKEDCLEECLQRLSTADRTLLLTYFEKEKRARIEHRSRLAEQLHISPNALRLRVHRMTVSVRDCTYDCTGTDLRARR